MAMLHFTPRSPNFVPMKCWSKLLAVLLAAPITAFSQLQTLPSRPPMEHPSTKMTVEIWSDVVCPFCYIGKREFEHALDRFPHKGEVEVVWKSFELDPNAPERSEHDMYGMLVEKYGGTREDAAARVEGVVQRAKTVGLEYRMDKAVIGNSFHAHRLIQFAKTKGKGAEAEERLFKAYFMEGAQLSDRSVLVGLAKEIGLDAAEVEGVLKSEAYSDNVRADEREAQQLGVQGVPFFVLDRKYGVSGAQSSEHFLGALKQAWDERAAAKP